MATDPGQDNNVCRICMTEITVAASVKGCNHAFCYHCLHQWTSTRQSPLCPICRTAVTVLVLADGSEQAAQPAAGDQQSEEVDLSCLDHNYFLAEVGRLLSRANLLHNRLYAEAYGCGRKGGSRQTQRGLDSIQDVLGVLSSYRGSLQDEERFDAEVLLQDLYRLDRQLTTAQNGGAHDAAVAAAPAAAGGGSWDERRQHERDYQEDEYWHEDDEDDDHHDEHDWHKGVSRTPGRAPASRHVKRNTRNSNSNSSVQQQQRQQVPRGRGRG
ncbi:hypothetical protein COO60DRAFT_1478529 [Scenedesmus sp. NREL 46B-D3]|nr:hypothetical protein COO60DRAFT_1478529 [Scenedesmus sp. NREL 46B-D3]